MIYRDNNAGRYAWTMGSIRFSLGRFNTIQEVDLVLETLPEIVADVSRAA